MVKEKAMDSASPSLQGGQGWVTLLKVLIAVLTAIAGSLGIVSCMRGGLSPSLSQGEGATIIAANKCLSEYEAVSPFREV